MSDLDQFRKLAPKPHPDWFWSLSGGLDSTAAFLLTKNIAENYHKRPVAVYLDTKIGIPLNRLYLEELVDRYGEQLWTLRTEYDFREYLESEGAPGGRDHATVRNGLKGRQSSKLATLADNPAFILGLRADESSNRATLSKVEEKRRHVEVYPVHRLSKTDCARIVLEHEDCPINPLWLWNHFSDCGCLSNGDPSELDSVEKRFPWFGQRLRELEEAADPDGLRGTLGWDGLTSNEKGALRHGQEQMTLCGEGCQRRRDPAVVRAFRARIRGSSPQESIQILEGETIERGVSA